MARTPKERTSRPGEYLGARAICERLGISRATLYLWIKNRQLLVYSRRAKTARHMLYTTDALLERWDLAQAIDYQQKTRAKDRAIASTAPATLGSDPQGPKVRR